MPTEQPDEPIEAMLPTLPPNIPPVEQEPEAIAPPEAFAPPVEQEPEAFAPPEIVAPPVEQEPEATAPPEIVAPPIEQEPEAIAPPEIPEPPQKEKESFPPEEPIKQSPSGVFDLFGDSKDDDLLSFLDSAIEDLDKSKK